MRKNEAKTKNSKNSSNSESKSKKDCGGSERSTKNCK